MATPKDIHEALLNHEEFDTLLAKLDTPGTVEDYRGTIDAYGNSSAATSEHELEELNSREVGALRLAWEAHHNYDNRQKVETSQ